MTHPAQPNPTSTRPAICLIGRRSSPTRRLALLSSSALLAMSAMPALVQAERTVPEPQLLAVPSRLTLACCKCLGGVNTLDLSTTVNPAWLVNGSPVVPVSQTHAQWDGLPPAIWVGPAAGANLQILPPGAHSYTLPISVPTCEIGGPVTISGQMLADDEGTVRLMKGNSQFGATFSTPLIAPGPPGWGFKIGKVTNFSYSLSAAGNYTLTVDVRNLGASPTGVVVRATASRRCGKNIGQVDPPKDDKP